MKLDLFPEAEEIQQVLESLSNGLNEVSRMEDTISSPTTPTWISEKLKDDLEELVSNIKGSAINIITSLSGG